MSVNHTQINHLFIGIDNVRPVVTETNKLLNTQLPQVKRSLALYLSNEETEQILFRPIRVSRAHVLIHVELGDRS